ncbi:unnamed protein product [Microthlaspi erraticum]|uniref:Uncharacterized protein n=1 Tax=Microthlaspi erraticum TaxID=1685480 RepID=A0A6D2IAC7_9BRAS|nr:unnamed protein product [Microthlaspi erraticum]
MNTRNPENLDREDFDLTINLKRSDQSDPFSVTTPRSNPGEKILYLLRDPPLESKLHTSFYPVFVSYSLGEGFAPSYAIHYHNGKSSSDYRDSDVPETSRSSLQVE